MSRFFSPRNSSLVPYVPGEQPRDQVYIKLNTNESPFPPSHRAVEKAAEAAKSLQLYSDPECTLLKEKFTEVFGLGGDRVLFTNGSDEALYFLFLAFCDEAHGAAFPAVSYGFYPVYADLTHTPSLQIPLKEDFSVDPADYLGLGRMILIANPNAPTGIALTRAQIETILRANPDNVVAVDEAYVDFGTESCLPLIDRYDNLIVIQTFSKSRSLAGARLGFAAGDPALIADLNTVKYSVNPYNINSMTMAAGIGALSDPEYTARCCRTIMENRAWLDRELRAMGFYTTDSAANFLFARHERLDGEQLYLRLKQRGVLIRHFAREDIRDFNRITVGTREQMEILVQRIREILEEEK
jgi:histidinol-phosphate aminotransferase